MTQINLMKLEPGAQMTSGRDWLLEGVLSFDQSPYPHNLNL